MGAKWRMFAISAMVILVTACNLPGNAETDDLPAPGALDVD